MVNYHAYLMESAERVLAINLTGVRGITALKALMSGKAARRKYIKRIVLLRAYLVMPTPGSTLVYAGCHSKSDNDAMSLFEQAVGATVQKKVAIASAKCLALALPVKIFFERSFGFIGEMREARWVGVLSRVSV
jgi:hypothetical protein